MRVTVGEALERVSERVYENRRSIRQSDLQRRDRILDLYGIEYYRVGDANAPARFYLSVSPDLIYHERFEFKLTIDPFTSTAGSGTGGAVVQVNDTRLEVEERRLSSGSPVNPNPHGHGITPNPHSHTTQPHTHAIDTGITVTPASDSGYRVKVEGIDITPYLMAQYGSWINGEGIYPSTDINKNYDLLEVASDMVAEGRKEEADLLLQPGYKPVEISANGPFSCTLTLYEKFSHTNR